MDSFNMLNPANPMSPLSPISIWDDDEPVREVVKRGVEASCSTCDSSIVISVAIVFVVILCIAIGFKIINS